MQCPQCQTPYDPQHNFCRECGANLPRPASLNDPGSVPSGAVSNPDLSALLTRALLLLDQGEFVEAEGAAQAAISMAPDNAEARFVLGNVLESRGRLAEAEAEYESALALAPTHAEAALRLDSLRDSRLRESRWRRMSNRKIALAVAGAVAACSVVGGFVLLSQFSNATNAAGPGSQSGRAGIVADASLGDAAGNSTLPVPPASAATAAPAPPSATKAPMGPPAPAALVAPPAPATPVVVPGTAVPPASRPVLPSAQRPGNLAPQTPALPHSLPQLPGPSAPAPSTPVAPGLPPAAVGQVVPIAPPAQPVAPGYPVAPAPGRVFPPGAAIPGSPAGASAPTPENPQINSAEKTPRVEPLESDTGFIKIEPAANSGTPRGQRAAQPAAPPSISVNIAAAPAPDSTAMLQDAQRALQFGDLARRRRLPAEAERHYQHAARLFDVLARRGGSTATPALEGLQAAQQGLASLRR